MCSKNRNSGRNRRNRRNSGRILAEGGNFPEKKRNSGGILPEKFRKFSILIISFNFRDSGKKRCLRINTESGGFSRILVEFFWNSDQNSGSFSTESSEFCRNPVEFAKNSGEINRKFRDSN